MRSHTASSQTPSIPRKGTETNFAADSDQHGRTRQTPSIPRKGTETKVTAGAKATRASTSDTLNSPQGDGNWLRRGRPSEHRLGGQTPSIPRKGTETHSIMIWAAAPVYSVRHPQFPARGRKRSKGFVHLIQDITVRHPQFPARGRKP